MSDEPALRWVVLRHEGIADPHYDFMFETAPGSPLQTYRVDAWPMSHDTTSARLPDHRKDYLDYEGPISGGRGHVRRIATGTYTPETSQSGVVLHLEPGQMKLTIAGEGHRLKISA